MRRFIGLGLLLAVLAACGPKATPQPTPTPAPLLGLTAEGWPYRGNPNAAVTLWEFFEFQ